MRCRLCLRWMCMRGKWSRRQHRLDWRDSMRRDRSDRCHSRRRSGSYSCTECIARIWAGNICRMSCTGWKLAGCRSGSCLCRRYRCSVRLLVRASRSRDTRRYTFYRIAAYSPGRLGSRQHRSWDSCSSTCCTPWRQVRFARSSRLDRWWSTGRQRRTSETSSWCRCSSRYSCSSCRRIESTSRLGSSGWPRRSCTSWPGLQNRSDSWCRRPNTPTKCSLSRWSAKRCRSRSPNPSS